MLHPNVPPWPPSWVRRCRGEVMTNIRTDRLFGAATVSIAFLGCGDQDNNPDSGTGIGDDDGDRYGSGDGDGDGDGSGDGDRYGDGGPQVRLAIANEGEDGWYPISELTVE